MAEQTPACAVVAAAVAVADAVAVTAAVAFAMDNCTTVLSAA